MQCGELASRLKWTRVVVLIPHKDDVWDLGLKIRFPGVMSDFYIIIDFKWKREMDGANSPSTSTGRRFLDERNAFI